MRHFIDEDGWKVWIFEADFSGDIGLDVARLWYGDEEEADHLWSVLQSDEGITDRSREVIYWGADVQDHIRPLKAADDRLDELKAEFEARGGTDG